MKKEYIFIFIFTTDMSRVKRILTVKSIRPIADVIHKAYKEARALRDKSYPGSDVCVSLSGVIALEIT